MDIGFSVCELAPLCENSTRRPRVFSKTQVFQASVPLLKAMDVTGVDVDICVDNHLGTFILLNVTL